VKRGIVLPEYEEMEKGEEQLSREEEATQPMTGE